MHGNLRLGKRGLPARDYVVSLLTGVIVNAAHAIVDEVSADSEFE